MEAFGLEGVVVADTRMSAIDGDRGELIIGGLPVAELAELSVEEVAARLWGGDADDLAGALADGRRAAHARLPGLGGALDAGDGMAALRGAVAQLDDDRPAAITGAVAVFAAAWWRRQRGLPPVAPSARSHAADYLRMCTGREPTDAEVAAIRSYLCCVVDHGMNASTFAARVVTSTRADAVSAVVAAIGALSGPLHGGAPGPVLDMLDAIGSPDAAADWIEGELAAGRRIMGMGHRVYRVRDPRAAVLERAARRLGGRRVELALAVEESAAAILGRRHPDRPLRANVELFTAVLLDAVGLDRRQFSTAFAVGRVVGWLGHIAEQRAWGRLIRPRARYLGPRAAAGA
jgi:citrate synthase